MGVVVVATIGARDLVFPVASGLWRSLDTPLHAPNPDLLVVAGQLQCDPSLRAVSAVLLSTPQNEFDMRFPILEPALAQVLAGAGAIEELLFVSTDQPANERLRVNDTADTARVMERLCLKRFGNRVKHVASDFVVLRQPDGDAAYGEIRSRLAELRARRPDDYLVVLPTGGIPRVKHSLRLASFNVYGPTVRVVEVKPPRPNATGADLGEVVEVKEPFIRETIRQSAIVLVGRHDYQGALATLDAFDPDSWPAELRQLLRTAVARANLDFGEGALGHYDPDSAAWKFFGDVPEYDAFGRAAEVLYLIGICLEQGRYADALFRTTLFCESCGWLTDLHVLGDAVAPYALGDFLPIRLLEHSHPELAAALSKAGVPVHPDHARHWKVDKPSHKSIITRYSNKLDPRTTAIRKRLKDRTLRDLATMRNQTIHFPNGVMVDHLALALALGIEPRHTVRERVRSALLTKLDRILRDVGALVGQAVKDSPYARLDDFITRELRLAP